jgi:hypothetical protein
MIMVGAFAKCSSVVVFNAAAATYARCVPRTEWQKNGVNVGFWR